MSRIYEQYITEICGENHHLFHEIIELKLESEYQQFHTERDKWINGEKTTEHSMVEWERLGKPLNKNRWNR
tara:strand:+ start:848 stop:1060 length:213 start_codon:yes stop_codon:yes gene_type:complete